MKTCLTALTLALVFAFPVSAAPPPSKQVAALKRENTALRAQVKRLKTDLTRARTAAADALTRADQAAARVSGLESQVATLTTERDTARNALTAAQSGISGAISTLSQPAVWALLRSAIAPKFNTSTYQQSYYASTDYFVWTFTLCGFCI